VSFTSPQAAASGEAAVSNAANATQLADLSLPAIQQVLNGVASDINITANGQIGVPKSVNQQYNQIATQTNQDYATVGNANNAFTRQSAKTSGNPYTSTMVSDQILSATQGLEASRRSAQQDIDYQKNVAGLSEYNSLLNLLGSGSGAALNLAGGFSGSQAQAIGGLSSTSPGQGAFGGAIAGAGIGTEVAPGYGTLLGAIVGGAGGYFGAGG
jgi:hypothetical protein